VVLYLSTLAVLGKWVILTVVDDGVSFTQSSGGNLESLLDVAADL